MFPLPLAGRAIAYETRWRLVRAGLKLGQIEWTVSGCKMMPGKASSHPIGVENTFPKTLKLGSKVICDSPALVGRASAKRRVGVFAPHADRLSHTPPPPPPPHRKSGVPDSRWMKLISGKPEMGGEEGSSRFMSQTLRGEASRRTRRPKSALNDLSRHVLRSLLRMKGRCDRLRQARHGRPDVAACTKRVAPERVLTGRRTKMERN